MLKHVIQKSIFINSNVNISFITFGNEKFLHVKDYNKYFHVPYGINCVLEREQLILKSSKHDLEFNFVFNSIFSFFRSIVNPSKKTLKLKGLGFRINLDNNLLEFKLGFSHTKVIKVPTSLNTTIRKNVISVEGVDAVLVGNFISKIKSLKHPDAYKGKGFWYKYEKESFKTIKKK